MRLNGVTMSDFDGSIEQFLRAQDLQRPGIAVALDGEIVSRSAWSSTYITPDSSIEVVTAAAGG